MDLEKPFFRNDVLVQGDGSRHRLLHLESEHRASQAPAAERRAWLMQLGAEKALPYAVTLEALRRNFRPMAMEPGQASDSGGVTAALPVLERPPSDASLFVAEKAYLRIAPLVDAPGIFEPSSRHALLVQRSTEPGGATPKTLLNDLRRWWQGGQTLNALVGTYANCGRPAGVGTERRGRKRKEKRAETVLDDALRRPYQLQQEDLDLMREVIEKYYFDKEVRRTLQATLLYLHRTHYTFLDGNGAKCLRAENECPSYRQLDYYLKSNYPLEVRLVRRKGEKRFAQEDRSTQGSIQIECHGAGHIYEFDATIVDVPLVSSMDRTDIVGKPTLYLIIDRETRLIVGFYIGFENASYSPAMQAILSIGEDKEALCRRLGLPYDPADWPAHGVMPEMFLADQGELMHKKARRIARALRSTLSNVPGLRPDWKPLVECGFMMIHQILAADTPAYVPDADTKKRRAVNRDKDVSLNIHEFTSVIVAAIIAHNKTMQVGYPLSIEQ